MPVSTRNGYDPDFVDLLRRVVAQRKRVKSLAETSPSTSIERAILRALEQDLKELWQSKGFDDEEQKVMISEDFISFEEAPASGATPTGKSE